MCVLAAYHQSSTGHPHSYPSTHAIQNALPGTGDSWHAVPRRIPAVLVFVLRSVEGSCACLPWHIAGDLHSGFQ
eukprot:12884869-Prorocentrum_lima.AAC.1